MLSFKLHHYLLARASHHATKLRSVEVSICTRNARGSIQLRFVQFRKRAANFDVLFSRRTTHDWLTRVRRRFETWRDARNTCASFESRGSRSFVASIDSRFADFDLSGGRIATFSTCEKAHANYTASPTGISADGRTNVVQVNVASFCERHNNDVIVPWKT